MIKPTFLALCGAPGSGKSQVQKILNNHFGCISVDDGRPVRDMAKIVYGLNETQVSTPKGKNELVQLPNGEVLTVREILGNLANQFEKLHGDKWFAQLAIDKCLKSKNNKSLYSFGSVRRNQAWAYKKHNAICIEVIRPGYTIVNEFDQYCPDAIDYKIYNTGSIEELKMQVFKTITKFSLTPKVF